MKIVIEYGLDDICSVAKEVAGKLTQYKILTLKGPLGAGKTTLVKSLMEELGVNPDDVTSPTFTYVNVYKLSGGKKVYHFDLYRIESAKNFLEMGFDEYLTDTNAYVLIEWPEVIKSTLPEHLAAEIDYKDQDSRRLILELVK